jgi:RNA recognition motif-containing protein
MRTVSRSALIVDGLALSLTSDDLTELFTPFGSILWTHVATDPFRRSLGFGYVVMETDEHATRAIEALQGHSIGGRVISIARTDVPPLPRTA